MIRTGFIVVFSSFFLAFFISFLMNIRPTKKYEFEIINVESKLTDCYCLSDNNFYAKLESFDADLVFTRSQLIAKINKNKTYVFTIRHYEHNSSYHIIDFKEKNE